MFRLLDGDLLGIALVDAQIPHEATVLPGPWKETRRDDASFTEQDLHGEGTVFVFYPFAFSPVCTDQLQLYEPLVADLREHGVRLFGVWSDSTWAQSAFAFRHIDRVAVKGQPGISALAVCSTVPTPAAWPTSLQAAPTLFRIMSRRGPRSASCAPIRPGR